MRKREREISAKKVDHSILTRVATNPYLQVEPHHFSSFFICPLRNSSPENSNSSTVILNSGYTKELKENKF